MMTKCSLDGYAYPYNAPENQNPAVKAVAATDTLKGRNYTLWGTDPSRQEITQNWPAMKAAMFDALKAKSLLPGTLPYVEDDGTHYTVIVMPPTYRRKVPGGVGYLEVTIKMFVVSSP